MVDKPVSGTGAPKACGFESRSVHHLYVLSSVGRESNGLLIRRSRVRAPQSVPYALLAQLVEQRTLNPKVVGSTPSRRTTCTNGETGTRARLRIWCPFRACEFDSHFVHHLVSVAQSVRAPGCGPGSRRFEAGHSPHGFLAQLVERQTEDLRVSGSIPGEPTTYGRMPESGQKGRTVNSLASAYVGSNPTSPTII